MIVRQPPSRKQYRQASAEHPMGNGDALSIRGEWAPGPTAPPRHRSRTGTRPSKAPIGSELSSTLRCVSLELWKLLRASPTLLPGLSRRIRITSQASAAQHGRRDRSDPEEDRAWLAVVATAR